MAHFCMEHEMDPGPQSQPLLRNASQPQQHSAAPWAPRSNSWDWSLGPGIPCHERLYKEQGLKLGAVPSARALCWAVPGTVPETRVPFIAANLTYSYASNFLLLCPPLM